MGVRSCAVRMRTAQDLTLILPNSLNPRMASNAPILLYDGDCGFCARSVQFVLHRDKSNATLRFASLQGSIGVAVRSSYPKFSSIDSLVWYEPALPDGHAVVLVRSAAVLRVLRYLGGVWWVLAVVGGIVPRPMRDLAYDFVARRRRNLVRAGEYCINPTAEQRTRFLDDANPALGQQPELILDAPYDARG